MPRLRAVVFDYGHTLLNFAPSMPALLACYAELRKQLEAEAYRDLPDAQGLVDRLARRVGEMVTESYRQAQLDEVDIVSLYETAFAALGVTLPRERVHEFAVMEHRAFVSELQAPAENLDVLRQLHDDGLKLGVVSNAHFLADLMHEDFDRLGIGAYLDDSVISSEMGVRKPHPAIFRKVLDELGVSPDEAIFVGDRVRDDIGGAQGIGMRGVLTRQYRQEEYEGTGVTPDYVVDRLPDLLPYVEAASGS